MKYVVFNMKANFMSFGCNDRGIKKYVRGTLEFPTISCIYGIICKSFGISKEESFLKKLNDEINILETFSFEKEVNIFDDFQSAGGGWDDNAMKPANCFGGKPTNGFETQIYHKQYLLFPHFKVVVEIKNDDFANEIVEKLKKPIWKDAFFGRKNCVPTQLIYDGIFNSKDECLNYIYDKKPFYKYTSEKPEKYAMYFGWINDIPKTSFDDKRSFGMREVFKVAL